MQQVVNMDNMPDEAASAFENAHTVFCTLGTTRKVGYVKAVARETLQLCASSRHGTQVLVPTRLLQMLLHNLMVTPHWQILL